MGYSIQVDNRLFGTKEGISINSEESGLHNPFKFNAQHPADLSRLTLNEHIQSAYRWWLGWQIRQQNRAVINGLDRIGFAALEDDVTLLCSCQRSHCHGYVIKDVIEAKLKELS